MAIKEQLESDIHDAMRSRDQDRLEALRFLKSQIQLTEKNQLKDLDETGVVEVVAKEARNRRESIEMFQQGDRPDLVAKETAALAVVEKYLPPQLGPNELAEIVLAAIREVGATSPADKGRVMGKVMPQVRGIADGGAVNALVTQMLEEVSQ